MGNEQVNTAYLSPQIDFVHVCTCHQVMPLID